MIPKNISLFLQGILMGTANKVPGVSGGAVAYVLGFYNELIYSFQKINKKALGLLYKRSFKSFCTYINAKFLVFLLGGVVFSYFSVSIVLDYLLERYELYVWSLFFGMIVGSAIYLIRKYNQWTTKSYVFLAIGVLLGGLINFIEPGMENHNLLFVFLCGMIGVSGMTIPGLSGSYILMLMGNYVFLLVDTVNIIGKVGVELISGNLATLQDPLHAEYLLVFVVFTLGSVSGLVFFSKMLAFVLNKWEAIVNAVIIGFVIGSLGTVWPWKEKIYNATNGVFTLDKFNHKIVIGFEKYWPNITLQENLNAILFLLLGVGMVLGIEHYSKIKNK